MNFDLIIIGGGINGAGIARDASMRGLKVLMLDKGDFGSGTSSRSTKLIHGGIRYLENYDFKLVWEACHERKILTQIAPHLVKTIPFVIPVYQGDKRPLWLIKLGMFLYDLMAGFQNLHRHQNLSAAEILKVMPNLKKEGLKGGGIYYDAQTDDARLVLANVLDAVHHGAVAKNYTKVVTMKECEDGIEVECEDTLTGEKTTYKSQNIVNATGPWLDQNLQKWSRAQTSTPTLAQKTSHTPKSAPLQTTDYKLPPRHLRLTKGIHFFVPRLTDEYAVLISAKKDNRVFFVIPHGKFSLVGTTDTDYKDDPDNVKVTSEDVEYLLNELHRLFPHQKLTHQDVVGEYAGLRPLLNHEGVKEGSLSREYQLKEEPFGASGHILHVIGGKITTYRHLAEKATDKVFESMGKIAPKCRTASEMLPKSSCDQAFEFESENGFNKEKSSHESLHVQTHPSQKSQTSNSENPENRIIPESSVTWAQLEYARAHEFVRTPEDFIRRRTELYLYTKKHPKLERKIAGALNRP